MKVGKMKKTADGETDALRNSDNGKLKIKTLGADKSAKIKMIYKFKVIIKDLAQKNSDV